MLFRTIWKLNSGSDVGLSRLMRRYVSVSGRAVIDMAVKDGELRVFIVAGEVSGDTIGSRLMASLRIYVRFLSVFLVLEGKLLLSQLFHQM
jgi:lipid-A-disaccharide synthase